MWVPNLVSPPGADSPSLGLQSPPHWDYWASSSSATPWDKAANRRGGLPSLLSHSLHPCVPRPWRVCGTKGWLEPVAQSIHLIEKWLNCSPYRSWSSLLLTRQGHLTWDSSTPDHFNQSTAASWPLQSKAVLQLKEHSHTQMRKKKKQRKNSGNSNGHSVLCPPNDHSSSSTRILKQADMAEITNRIQNTDSNEDNWDSREWQNPIQGS